MTRTYQLKHQGGYNSWEIFLEDLDDESKILSNRLNHLLYDEKVEWIRYDSSRSELVIRFKSGRTLMIDGVKNKYNISVT